MSDIIIFLTQQFFNIFIMLDNIEIFGALTFLRLIIISILVIFIFKFVRR